MNKVNLAVEKRKLTGRKVKQLRKGGVLPANIFGKKFKSQEIQVRSAEFTKTFKEAGETGIVSLKMGSDEIPVLIHDVQRNPLTNDPIHIDFLHVDLKQKVVVKVPLELVGESSAEKQGIGTVVQYIDEIEVEALPGDFPDKIEINISGLDTVNKQICVKDLSIDSRKLEVKADSEQILVKVEASTKEEIVETPKPSTEEGVQPEADTQKEGIGVTADENQK